MFLAVDAGNTKITFGFFEGDLLKNIENVSCPANVEYSDLKNSLEKFLCNYSINTCMISSVVDELTENLKKAISEICSITPLLLMPELSGVKIRNEHPEKYGADRVANACAASKMYEKRPLIVVDSGSATTFEILNAEDELIGGLIMPGMELQLKALGEKTSKLPVLDLNRVSDNINVISNNTEEAIYAGVVIAHAQAVQGLIKLCEQKLGQKAFLVGTGGNIKLLNKFLNERKFDVINPTLTLDGIRMIYEINMQLI